MRMNFVDVLAYLLLIAGGINWALTELFNYNLVDSIFGVDSTAANIVYGLIGLSAVWGLISLLRKTGRSESTERVEYIERSGGHAMDREAQAHPAERAEQVGRAGYGATSHREDRRTRRR